MNRKYSLYSLSLYVICCFSLWSTYLLLHFLSIISASIHDTRVTHWMNTYTGLAYRVDLRCCENSTSKILCTGKGECPFCPCITVKDTRCQRNVRSHYEWNNECSIAFTCLRFHIMIGCSLWNVGNINDTTTYVKDVR